MNSSKTCSRCVLDTSVSDIAFDSNGVCNYCTQFLENCNHIIDCDVHERESNLKSLVEQIKKDGKGKKYDCIVGVSGGVDSSWVLVNAKNLGLRPLAVHMDNGWNSELAQKNIENLIENLDVDLYTHVINWTEYKGMMQAFFDADVIDVELLYDNAMTAVNFELARKYKIKYILTGCNAATEGFKMPTDWNWFKKDKKNIMSIVKKFSNVSTKTFPSIGAIESLRYTHLEKINWVSFLDLFDFKKESALAELEDKYGYRRYPYKHYESVFTRFYQGYILPEKFNVDKRKLHLSNLVVTGQMDREQALNLLKEIPYHSEQELLDDKEYFLKKMGWSESELENYLSRSPIPHSNYPSEKPRWLLLIRTYKKLSSFFR